MILENPDVFLADFGVPCVKGSASFLGLLDTPDEMLAGYGVNMISTMYALTIKTSDADAAAIASGDAITVDGQARTVRDVMLTDDGAFTRLTLQR